MRDLLDDYDRLAQALARGEVPEGGAGLAQAADALAEEIRGRRWPTPQGSRQADLLVIRLALLAEWAGPPKDRADWQPAVPTALVAKESTTVGA